ncbi:MAG: chemotaxis protein CheA [Oligoflexus sp.]|nr:chemotaxis protein CheA [Oligoflexus sp.]
MTNSDIPNEFLAIFLEEALDILSDWERNCLALEVAADDAVCSALFRSAHNLKGSARSVGLAEYGKFIHCAEDLITLIRDGKIKPSSEIVKILLEAQTLLLEWRDKLVEDSRFVPSALVADLSLRLKALSNEPGESPVEASAGFGFFDDESVPAFALNEFDDSPSFTPATTSTNKTGRSISATKAKSNETIRIPAHRIDGLMQLIGELSIQQSTILHSLKHNTMGEPICHKAIHIAAKLTRELQLQTMGLRLVDLSKLFQKLERTARDLATDQKKDIVINLVGADVELDKNVIERISDPLVHMIRNAVDHGIESSSKRGSKSQTATINLSAFQSSSGVTIQISDDGHGIDQERVLTKAKGLGLVKEGQQLIPSKIYELMFAPGFSTASQVTEVSGRGVGLDVVKRTIDELGGSIEIESKLGEGTSFAISLPLTVSIVDSLIIVANGQSYVVPIQEISEVIDLRSFQPESKYAGSQTISLREKALTIKPLHVYLPIKERVDKSQALKQESPSSHPVMVIEADGQKVGFSFDRIVGQQPVLIRQLADYISDVPGFAGNTVLANGDPALIVSPKVFARQYLRQKEGMR